MKIHRLTSLTIPEDNYYVLCFWEEFWAPCVCYIKKGYWYDAMSGNLITTRPKFIAYLPEDIDYDTELIEQECNDILFG